MSIERITTVGAVAAEEVEQANNIVLSDSDGDMRIINIKGQDRRAVMFVPSGSERAEFVCAGKPGAWMKEIAQNYLTERPGMSEDDIVLAGCSAEVFDQMVSEGYTLVRDASGMMSFDKISEGYTISVSCPAWQGEEGSTVPSLFDDEWTVSRFEMGAHGQEIGSLSIMEGMGIDEALGVAAQIETSPVSGDQIFASVVEFEASLEGSGVDREEEPSMQLSMF